MRIPFSYVVTPSPDLVRLAMHAGAAWLAEPGVWASSEHHNVREHSREQVQDAWWALFLAKLSPEPNESDAFRDLRKHCLRLGFDGCWSIYEADREAPTSDLVAEAAKPTVQELAQMTLEQA